MYAWRVRNPVKASWHRLKAKAKARKIEFTLSLEQFQQLCEITGYVDGKGRASSCLSIDRIDFQKGYELSNIRVITVSENSAKGYVERKLRAMGVAMIDVCEAIQAEPTCSCCSEAYMDPDLCPF